VERVGGAAAAAADVGRVASGPFLHVTQHPDLRGSSSSSSSSVTTVAAAGGGGGAASGSGPELQVRLGGEGRY
jgi:hypothetical protein